MVSPDKETSIRIGQSLDFSKRVREYKKCIGAKDSMFVLNSYLYGALSPEQCTSGTYVAVDIIIKVYFEKFTKTALLVIEKIFEDS